MSDTENQSQNQESKPDPKPETTPPATERGPVRFVTNSQDDLDVTTRKQG